MSPWQIAAVGLLSSLLPCAWMTLHGKVEQRLVGLQMTGLVITLAMVVLTVAFGRGAFIDLALTSAIVSFGSGLVFARFLEKHL